MSFLGLLGAAAGGYSQGRQRRFEDTIAQQAQQNTQSYDQAQIAAENARVALAQQEAKRNEITSNANLQAQGLGPDGKPLPPLQLPADLQRIVPGKVGPNYQVTPQDQIAHYMGIGNAYLRAGRQIEAQPYFDQAKAIQTEVLRQLTSQDTLDRELKLRSIPSAPTYADQWNIDHGLPPGDRQPAPISAYEQWEIDHGGAPGSGNKAASHAASVATKQAGQAYNDFKQLWTNYTKVPAGPISGIAPIDPKTGKQMTAPLNPAQQQQLQEDFARLDASTNPSKDLAGMLQGIKNPAVVQALKAYGKYREAQKRAEDATNAESTGGSDAGGNFPQYPGQ